MAKRLTELFQGDAVPLGQVSTHWGTVLAARELTPDGDAALRRVAERYYAPVFSTLRAVGYRRDDAMELTHQFMAALCARKFIEQADPARGSFRALLQTCLRNLIGMQGRRDSVRRTQPIDEARAPASGLTPEEAFDRELAWHCFQQACEATRVRLADSPRAWEVLSRCDLEDSPDGEATHEALASSLGMELGAFRRALYDARHVFEEEVCRLLLEEAGPGAHLKEEIARFLHLISLGPVSQG